jgi:transcriptional regulator with XRE-family HTH domain
MIAAKVVTEVRRLLAEGVLSQRRISELTGISRGSVRAIASGKRPDYEALRQPADDEWDEPTGPAVRCPGCGGMVCMPCQLCRVRKTLAKNSRPKSPDRTIQGVEPLDLNLRPEHRARFEEVRAWRRENGNHVIDE